MHYRHRLLNTDEKSVQKCCSLASSRGSTSVMSISPRGNIPPWSSSRTPLRSDRRFCSDSNSVTLKSIGRTQNLLLHCGFDNVETGKTTNRRVYCHGQLLCRSIGYRSFPEKRLLFHFTFREVRRRPLSTASISPFHHVFTPSADMVTHRHFLFCTSFNSVTGLGTFDNTPSAHYHDTPSLSCRIPFCSFDNN